MRNWLSFNFAVIVAAAQVHRKTLLAGDLGLISCVHVCVCACVCAYVQFFVRVCVYTCNSLCMCLYLCVHKCMHVCVSVWICMRATAHTQFFVPVCAFVCACMRARVHVYVCVRVWPCNSLAFPWRILPTSSPIPATIDCNAPHPNMHTLEAFFNPLENVLRNHYPAIFCLITFCFKSLNHDHPFSLTHVSLPLHLHISFFLHFHWCSASSSRHVAVSVLVEEDSWAQYQWARWNIWFTSPAVTWCQSRTMTSITPAVAPKPDRLNDETSVDQHKQ